jgi:hypothetical protein
MNEMNSINSITGLLPRKVNISFKKRDNNSIIEKIGVEIKSKLSDDFTGLESRIKVILGVQAKYSGNVEVVTRELIDLCHGFILDEIEIFQKSSEEVEFNQALIDKKNLWVEYYSGGWKTQWRKVPFWGYVKEFKEEEEDCVSSPSC